MKSPVLTRAFFQKCGRQGGLKGGKARAKSLSKERRSEIARMGGVALQRARKKNGDA